MTIERLLVIAYLLGCIGIGIFASRRVKSNNDEYWVAGRRIGPWVNAMAIMAALASGGSILGVIGLAYGLGIPTTLAYFAGSIVGFPLAAILVARPLRKFGKFTISDFLSWRYPHPIIRIGVPLLIVVSFTMYIVAQIKAAGITGEQVLGMSYSSAVTLSTLVFVLYVSFGGMLAITWTDVVQGTLMLLVVVGTAAVLIARNGSPSEILQAGFNAAPELAISAQGKWCLSLGGFVTWAAAIPIIPHVVMRVYTAKDAHSAKQSLNLAMIFYSTMILLAVFIVVPVAKVLFPTVEDKDSVFLLIMQTQFNPLVRGGAVAAVMAAVMSTTDALLLACSSAIAHDLIANAWGKSRQDNFEWTPRALARINMVVVWVVGLVAMYLAYDPPQLITEHYTKAVGALSSGLFVPVVAGLWWKPASLYGGVASFLAGVVLYGWASATDALPAGSAILLALPTSLLVMVVASLLFPTHDAAKLEAIRKLHE